MSFKFKKAETNNGFTVYECYSEGFSINKALKIQQEQLEHYGNSLSPDKKAELIRIISSKTNIPANINRDEELSIRLINTYVPRGGDIENAYYSLRKEG